MYATSPEGTRARYTARQPRQDRGQEEVLAYSGGPHGPGGERQKQALRIDRVEEEAGGEERQGEHGPLGRPRAPPLFGYAIDEVEREEEGYQGDEDPVSRESASRDGPAE